MNRAFSANGRGADEPRALPWAGMNDAVGVPAPLHFLLSESNAGLKGDYAEPAADLAFHKLAQLLFAQVAAFTGCIKEL